MTISRNHTGHRCGEAHHRARLTDDQVSEMRQFRELAALRVALKEAQEILNWALEQQT